MKVSQTLSFRFCGVRRQKRSNQVCTTLGTALRVPNLNRLLAHCRLGIVFSQLLGWDTTDPTDPLPVPASGARLSVSTLFVPRVQTRLEHCQQRSFFLTCNTLLVQQIFKTPTVFLWHRPTTVNMRLQRLFCKSRT